MSDVSYLKFSIVTGIIAGTIGGIPLLGITQFCCCLPLMLCSGGAVSWYLKANQGATMRQMDALLSGLITGVVGTCVYFVVYLSINSLFFVLSPETLQAFQVPGMEMEKFGLATVGFGQLFLFSLLMTLFYGTFYLILGPLSALAGLHLFHKERINRE